MYAYIVDHPEGAFTQVDLPRPVPTAGQVLLRVRASGVNPLDTKIRAGNAGHANQALPAVLGLDMAGVVEQVGPGVTAFRPGDEVYGMVGGVGGMQGTLAEFVVADADLIALKPKSLSMREASALPLITITAWEGIVDRAKVHHGQKVLIHAGAGGVGHIAVQLAKAFGAEVFATVSPRRHTSSKSSAQPPSITARFPRSSMSRFIPLVRASTWSTTRWEELRSMGLSSPSSAIPGTW